MDQKPSIGRIVHVFRARSAKPVAAIVTRVDDATINATLFVDGFEKPYPLASIPHKDAAPDPSDVPVWDWPARA